MGGGENAIRGVEIASAVSHDRSGARIRDHAVLPHDPKGHR